ncbi:hypothetical protein [Bacillus sp. T3]|uniref:hypothetical protein n=1 Tax=Bacillus sp. T3 TaxID=467262 RepID=UPI00298259DD|nr:hypothetical protein [Bacillus sp. T3]
MFQKNPHLVSGAEVVDSNWRLLYKSGSVAAVIMVAIILMQFIIFITWPPPLDGSVLEWYELFQNNWLLGILSFEFLMIVYNVLALLMILSFFVILRKINQPLTSIFLITSLLGIIAFIVARPVFEMLYLSNQYAVATTEIQKNMILAAGEGMLAIFNGTTFYISYILGSISGLLISVVMLKSHIFSKTTAYLRIGSSILDFGLFIPTIGLYISMFSVVFLLIWNIMIARRLIQLSRL